MRAYLGNLETKIYRPGYEKDVKLYNQVRTLESSLVPKAHY